MRFLGMFLVLRFLFKASSLCEVFGRQILDMHLSFRIPSKSRTRVTWHSSIFLCGFLFSGVHLFLFCDRIEAVRNITAQTLLNSVMPNLRHASELRESAKTITRILSLRGEVLLGPVVLRLCFLMTVENKRQSRANHALLPLAQAIEPRNHLKNQVWCG